MHIALGANSVTCKLTTAQTCPPSYEIQSVNLIISHKSLSIEALVFCHNNIEQG